MSDLRSIELLRIIADTVGVDRNTFDACKQASTATADHRAILLFRLIRAFRALPDGAARLQALQFVEGLAAHRGPPE